MFDVIQDQNLESKKYDKVDVMDSHGNFRSIYVHYKSRGLAERIPESRMITPGWKPDPGQRVSGLKKLVKSNPLARVFIGALSAGVLSEMACEYCHLCEEKTSNVCWSERAAVFDDYDDQEVYEWLPRSVASLTVQNVMDAIHAYIDLAKAVAEWQEMDGLGSLV